MQRPYDRLRRWSSTRLSIVILAMMAPAAPFVVVGAARSVAVSRNDLLNWAADDLSAKQRFQRFADRFGREDLAVVSWPGCTIGDERLERMAAQLRASQDGAYFDRIVTGADLLRRAVESPFDISRSRAIRCLQGTALGPNAEATCLLVTFSERGSGRRGEAIQAVRRAAERTAGLHPDQLRMGGPAVDLHALTRESIRSPVLLGFVALAYVCVACRFLLGGLPLTALIVFIALFSAAFAMALPYWLGEGMNAVLMPMPSLVLVLTVSCSIHVVNYFRRESARRADHVARRTLRRAWLPCSLSAGTTAAGLAALLASDTPPVREFGFYSAIAICVGAGLAMAVLPGALEAMAPASVAGPQRVPVGRGRCSWSRYAGLIGRRHLPITAAGLVSLLVFGVGLGWLDMSVNVGATFAPRTRIIQDTRWLEANVRPLSQLEAVVRFPEDCVASPVERLQVVRALQAALPAAPEVRSTFSIADLTGDLPTGRGLRATARRAALNGRLTAHREFLRETNYYATQGAEESWRISAHVNSLTSTRYADLLDNVSKLLDQAASGWRDKIEFHVDCTGLIPLYDQIQDQMLRDLIGTYCYGFAAITLILCLVLRDAAAGVLCMAPNAFPVVIVLGALGWLGVRADVGSVMTASVALGIAVDDTLHFVIGFRRGLRAGRQRPRAVVESFRHCGGAMIQTTLLCAVGVHFLGYSSFIPTARFGWLIAAMLFAALVGDAVILPAMLIGPLGRIFQRMGKSQ